MAQKIQVGVKGFNADIPPYSLPTEYWNKGLNMRVKDGSVQAVPAGQELYYPNTTAFVFPVIDADTPEEVNEIRMVKYNPDGFAYADMLIAGVNINGNGRIRFSTNYTPPSGGSSVVDVGRPRYSGGPWLEWKYDYDYGIDMFVMNEIAVVNPKGSVNSNGASTPALYFNANDKNQMNMQPMYQTPTKAIDPNRWVMTTLTTPNEDSTVANQSVLPGTYSWSASPVAGEAILTATIAPSQAQLTPGDVITNGIQNLTNNVPNGTYNYWMVVNVTGSTVTITDVNGTAKTAFPANTKVYYQYPYAARYLTTFENRMMGLNFILIRGGVVQDQSPIEFAWSNPITSLQSFSTIQWLASATNSAGNDYLTDTSGTVLAAVPLQEYLMLYKSDTVYKTNNTGAPYYYVSQPLYTDDGIIGPRAVVEINESKHLFVGNNGIWLHQGGIEKQNISRGFVEEFFYRGDYGIDLTYKNLTFCYLNQLEKEVWICYRSKQAYAPSDGFQIGDVPGCNYALVYNYETKIWYWRSLGREVTGAQSVVSDANYFTDIQDILTNAQTYTLVCAPDSNFANVRVPDGLWYVPHVTSSGIPSFGLYESNGYIQFDSRDIGTASIVKNCNGIFPHSAQPINFQLKFSNNIVDNNAINNALVRRFDPINFQYQNYRLDYRETGRYMHLKLSLAGYNNDGAITVQNPACNPYFTDMDIDMEQRGRR